MADSLYIQIWFWPCVFVCLLQTIVTAMSTLTPPVQLACPQNQYRIEYILNLVNQKDFEFPSVSPTKPPEMHIHSQIFLSVQGQGYIFMMKATTKTTPQSSLTLNL